MGSGVSLDNSTGSVQIEETINKQNARCHGKSGG
jgi:hypothetical protein